MGQTCCNAQINKLEDEFIITAGGATRILSDAKIQATELSGRIYYKSEIMQIIRLQRKIVNFLDKQRVIRIYESLCATDQYTTEEKKQSIQNVKAMITQFGPFM